MKQLKIGIVFNMARSMEQLISESGLNQNVIFYYDLFVEIGHDVCMIVENRESSSFELEGRTYNMIAASELISESIGFDVILEGGLSFVQEDRMLIRKRCGARIVSPRFGNAYILDAEHIFVHKEKEGSMHTTGVEAVWVCPDYYRQKEYFEALYDAPVYSASFVWEPRFMPSSIDFEQVEKLDVVVMEPNFSTMKNCLVPLAMMSELYRVDPESYRKFRVLGNDHFLDKAYFKTNFIDNLPALNPESDKMSYEARQRFFEVFTRPDVLLSWTHLNELNYLYCEALYAGIPLVHNGAMISDIGFYFPESNIEAGIKQLQLALKQRDFEAKRQKGQEYLARTMSIYSQSVQDDYAHLLERVMRQPLRS